MTPTLRLLALLLLSSTAFAEPTVPMCSEGSKPYAEVKAALAEKYREEPIAIGLAPGQGPGGDNAVMELYGARSETWTVLVTALSTGQSCALIVGVRLKIHLPPWKEQGA